MTRIKAPSKTGDEPLREGRQNHGAGSRARHDGGQCATTGFIEPGTDDAGIAKLGCSVADDSHQNEDCEEVSESASEQTERGERKGIDDCARQNNVARGEPTEEAADKRGAAGDSKSGERESERDLGARPAKFGG